MSFSIIFFHKGSLQNFKMYCKVIEEVCRESLGETQCIKKGRKAKWEEAEDFDCRTLWWSVDFPRVCEEPLNPYSDRPP
jgi:hypothetical protein